MQEQKSIAIIEITEILIRLLARGYDAITNYNIGRLGASRGGGVVGRGIYSGSTEKDVGSERQ